MILVQMSPFIPWHASFLAIHRIGDLKSCLWGTISLGQCHLNHDLVLTGCFMEREWFWREFAMKRLLLPNDCPQNIIQRVLFFSVVDCLKTNGVEIINWYDTFLLEGHTVFPTFNFVWKLPLVLSQSMSGLSSMKGDAKI